MPNTIYLPEDIARSGVRISFTKSTTALDIASWYDGFVSDGATAMTLAEFFTALGITERHLKRALREMAA